MPTEFSNYIETRPSAGGTLDGSELLIASKGGESVSFTTQELIDEIAGGGVEVAELSPTTKYLQGPSTHPTQPLL